MNMVMVGRQLEKFKHEKKAIKKKIRALQKLANNTKNSSSIESPKNSGPLLVTETANVQEQVNNDWTSEVRTELFSILEGIPTNGGSDNKGIHLLLSLRL